MIRPFPKLFATGEAALADWARRVIAYFEQEQSTTVTEAPVSSESVGMVRVWLGATAPAGWLQLDGSMQFQTEYPALFEFLGSVPAGAPPYDNMFYLPNAPTALNVGIWIVKAN